MPAWIAAIQTRMDASEDIHVNLDSSTPCWNDAFESFCFDADQGSSSATKFSMEHKGYEGREHFLRMSSPLSGLPILGALGRENGFSPIAHS
jgi:hypothetical protein